MGERQRDYASEVLALRLGLDLGLTLIDTAEIYADGGAEQVVAEAIAGRRDQVFLVTKIHPGNATGGGTIEACERSLKRLRTDRIDLYLLHWRATTPIEETLDAFGRLIDAGKIRYFGVSNFGARDLEELWATPGGAHAATNQVLYNPGRRGIEWDLLPWCRSHEIPIMAYTPLEQGRLQNNKALHRMAKRMGVTPLQIALAWVLRDDNVIAIPKAGDPEHVRANQAALELELQSQDFVELDRAFPPPTGPTALEML